jgi:hypothetical protein
VARQLARRRQRERIAGTIVVLLGVAVAVVAVIALRQPNGHVAAAQSQQSGSPSNVAENSSGRPASGSKASRSTGSTTSRTGNSLSGTSVKDVPLIVLNNTTIPRLAAQAAQQFEAGGWTVTKYDNYTNAIASTCAYYDPSYPGAKAAAEALRRQYPTIKRVEPRFAPDPGAEPLPDGPVVVVLTPDYSST